MKSDKHEELRSRTKQFALRLIRMSQALPASREADVIARQILRSGTSVAANYLPRADRVQKPSSSQKWEL